MKQVFLYTLLLVVLNAAVAQVDMQPLAGLQSISKKEQGKLRKKYLAIGAGFSSIIYRDLATSPLFYAGTTANFSLTNYVFDSSREIDLGGSYDIGLASSSFNAVVTRANVHRFDLLYSHLFTLKGLSSHKIRSRAGFKLNGTGTVRLNESFQNNAVGLEAFTTLFGSFKLTKDISRKQEKTKRFLFIKYRLKPKAHKLSFRLNVGVVNGAYRNGFVYIDQSALTGNPNLFEDHEYRLFSGSRLGSCIDYTQTLANKNAIRFSYNWDAYKTGGELDRFEMAQHSFRFTLLFNRKSN